MKCTMSESNGTANSSYVPFFSVIYSVAVTTHFFWFDRIELRKKWQKSRKRAQSRFNFFGDKTCLVSLLRKLLTAQQCRIVKRTQHSTKKTKRTQHSTKIPPQKKTTRHTNALSYKKWLETPPI